MLVNLNKVLPKARKGRYAVGHFNTSNLEITQAIIKAAKALKAPVIIATSETAIAYAGIETISQIVRTMAHSVRIPVVLHLDHGATFDIVKTCIKHGYTSVMVDGSRLSFRENVNITRRVVRYAHKHDVTVEAEIGRLAGIEDDIRVKKDEAVYTDPDEARRFVQQTGCDALAIAIGTSHGAYKFKGTPKLRIDILRQITQAVEIPLVLHGASGVKNKWLNRINRFGGKLARARGVPDTLIKQAVKHGISKINTDTDLRIAFTAGVREYLKKNPKDFDPRRIIGYGQDMIRQVVEDRIKTLGSKKKA